MFPPQQTWIINKLSQLFTASFLGWLSSSHNQGNRCKRRREKLWAYSIQVNCSYLISLADNRFTIFPVIRFLASGVDSSITTNWWIPLGIETPQGITFQILKDKTSTVTLKGVSKDDWVKLNPGMTGFYRGNWDSNNSPLPTQLLNLFFFNQLYTLRICSSNSASLLNHWPYLLLID